MQGIRDAVRFDFVAMRERSTRRRTHRLRRGRRRTARALAPASLPWWRRVIVAAKRFCVRGAPPSSLPRASAARRAPRPPLKISCGARRGEWRFRSRRHVRRRQAWPRPDCWWVDTEPTLWQRCCGALGGVARSVTAAARRFGALKIRALRRCTSVMACFFGRCGRLLGACVVRKEIGLLRRLTTHSPFNECDYLSCVRCDQALCLRENLPDEATSARASRLRRR